MRENLPKFESFCGKSLPSRPDIQIIEYIASGFDGHVFRAHMSAIHRDVACKIIPRANLQHDPEGKEVWRNEVLKADSLRSPTVVRFEGVEEWKDAESQIDCVVLIAEFVEGVTLQRFINQSGTEITIPFIRDWLATMLNLLNEMAIRDIAHGDLHAGNILVEDRSSYDLLGPRYVFRVTDFGVAEATSEHRFKDDYDQLADILDKMLREIDFSILSPKDKFLFRFLRDHFLARHLVERDPTLDVLCRQPKELLRRLQELDQEFERTMAQDSNRLVSPFDFLSCEQIGDAPDLLRALYSDLFLGLSEIESRNNVVVTGPRGCGKSTVFRNLSLAHRIRVNDALPENISYIGIYYRCDDLYFAFPRYRIPTRIEALDIPIHFVTATLLATLLESIEHWARIYFSEEFTANEQIAAKALWDILGISPPQTPGKVTFDGIVATLNKQRLKATSRQRFAFDEKRDIGMCFGPEILMKACETLVKTLSFLKQRPIYFLIDDYSSPKVSRDLQASLNRVFMQRTPVCFFKLSTESPVSFVSKDIDEKVYVENREFILYNLGLAYLGAEIEPKLSFVEDVFRRRLSNSAEPFPASELHELIGRSPKIVNSEMARQTREGTKTLLWGCDVLCLLCSGDIHYLISLVGDMVRSAGGAKKIEKSKDGFLIPATVQNGAIRAAAGSFLKNLRAVPQFGEQLVAVVEAFGNVAYSHLRFLDSKNGNDSPPKQASRIEPYEAFALSEHTQQLYNELLRYSVFIEDFRGKSRRGRLVPRLYLRRFLIPHFNLTFSTRDSIELEPADFESFLGTPKAFEAKFRMKGDDDVRRAESRAAETENQLSLKLGDEKL